MERMIEDNEKNEEKESGATMLEYGLLAALIAVVCIVAVTFLGQSASESFSRVGQAIDTANNPG